VAVLLPSRDGGRPPSHLPNILYNRPRSSALTATPCPPRFRFQPHLRRRAVSAVSSGTSPVPAPVELGKAESEERTVSAVVGVVHWSRAGIPAALAVVTEKP
jgi:hypothetical protein